MRRRTVTTGVAAGAVVMAMATMGVTVADASGSQPTPTPSGSQQTCPPTGPSMGPGMGLGGPMRAVNNEFDYLTQMMAHHQEAITAAQQLRRSGRPEMRRLGETIVTTQSSEIQQMKAWLAQWYPGRSTEVQYQPMMRDLSKLSGDALDKTFLQDMLPHHMMAVMMSQQLLMRVKAEHEGVAGFARTVRDTQHAEMFQMWEWLSTWFGGQSMPMPTGTGMPHMPMPTGTGMPHMPMPTGTGMPHMPMPTGTGMPHMPMPTGTGY
ncbi:DUF305 domain-containing protein [Streptosporangium canum]|uniref:DUF305 domain-containing protein n=1 Tax=Streptosporangium canum TaxID=324952 RepID=UPI0036C94DDC